MTLNLSQDVINRRVFNQSVYNSHKQNFMLGQTERWIDKDKNVIDVGAAVGMYSHYWAGLAKEVFSFEAVPPVFEQLKLTALRNDNMHVFNKAVGSFQGTTNFYVDDKRLSNSSFRDLVGGQKIRVEVVSLDWMQEDFGDVCFIKIDVEGNELDVLHGGIRLIEKYQPTIMCEIYPKFNDGPVENTFAFFEDAGYKYWYYNIKGQGLQEIKSIKEGCEIASNEKLIAQHDGDFLFSMRNKNGD